MKKNLENTVTINKIIVHGGVFHADDVLCCAMARIINPDVVIERSNNPAPEDVASDGSSGTWVADVGLGRFDHHQLDVKLHTDGTKYAACGLLYEVWKPVLMDGIDHNSIAAFETLMRYIECADNGGMMAMANTIVNSFRPCWDDDYSMDDGFNDAVNFMESAVMGILHQVPLTDGDSEGLIDALPSLCEEYPGSDSGVFLIMGYAMYTKDTKYRGRASRAAKAVFRQLTRVEDAQTRADAFIINHYGDQLCNTVVFLDKCIPWMTTLIPRRALYVSYPAIRGGWNIQCVPVAVGNRVTKKPFPAEWVSNPESRPAGCTFVHPAGHLAAFATREDAEAAAKLLEALAQE